MIRGVVTENHEELGAKYTCRVYLYDWGVHVEGHGDTPRSAAYPVKRAIQTGLRSVEGVEFHAINFDHDVIRYDGRL
jgi:hypothetical protein